MRSILAVLLLSCASCVTFRAQAQCYSGERELYSGPVEYTYSVYPMNWLLPYLFYDEVPHPPERSLRTQDGGFVIGDCLLRPEQ